MIWPQFGIDAADELAVSVPQGLQGRQCADEFLGGDAGVGRKRFDEEPAIAEPLVECQRAVEQVRPEPVYGGLAIAPLDTTGAAR